MTPKTEPIFFQCGTDRVWSELTGKNYEVVIGPRTIPKCGPARDWTFRSSPYKPFFSCTNLRLREVLSSNISSLSHLIRKGNPPGHKRLRSTKYGTPGRSRGKDQVQRISSDISIAFRRLGAKNLNIDVGKQSLKNNPPSIVFFRTTGRYF